MTIVFSCSWSNSNICAVSLHDALPIYDFRAVGEGIGNTTQKLLHGKLSTLPVSYVIIPTQKADRNREGFEFMKKTPAVNRQRQHIFIHQKSGAVSLSPEPLQQGSPSRGFIGYTRSGKGEIGTFRDISSAVGAKKAGLEPRQYVRQRPQGEPPLYHFISVFFKS